MDAVTGANVGGWSASVGGTVRGLVVSLDGSRLFICGGGFQTVSGQHRAFAAAVNTSNGSLLPWAPNPDRQIYAITDRREQRLRGRAAAPADTCSPGRFPRGPSCGRTTPTATSTRSRSSETRCSPAGTSRSSRARQQARLVALSVSTGTPDTSFHPTLTGNSLGAIALASDGSHLAVGGDFTRVNGVNQPRLTSFSSH